MEKRTLDFFLYPEYDKQTDRQTDKSDRLISKLRHALFICTIEF